MVLQNRYVFKKKKKSSVDKKYRVFTAGRQKIILIFFSDYLHDTSRIMRSRWWILPVVLFLGQKGSYGILDELDD